MKKLLTVLSVSIALALYLAYLLTLGPDTSIAAWRKDTGYKGPVCIVAVDRENRPYCSNHVAYNPGTINAYEGYAIWSTCKQLPSALVCNND